MTARTEDCEFCRGTGKSPRTHHRCPECYGAGEVEVEAPAEPEPTADEVRSPACIETAAGDYIHPLHNHKDTP